MTDVIRDNNHVSTLLGLSYVDGTTDIAIGDYIGTFT